VSDVVAAPEPLMPVRWPAASIGTTIYTVFHGSVVKFDVGTGAMSRRLIHARDEADYQVVADPATHRIWVVSTVDDITIYELDSRTLQLLSRVRWNGIPIATAVLDGRFYVSTPSGVLDLPKSAHRPLLARIHGGDVIAADPARHRLVDLSFRQMRQLGLGAANLAVVAGSVWVAGGGTAHAVLARLEPSSLRLVAASPLAAHLDPTAVISASDDARLLVRTSSSMSSLWCVDGRTGAILQYWPTALGTPVLAGGTVYQLSESGPSQLPAGGCSTASQ
jgi:hypothetical protein